MCVCVCVCVFVLHDEIDMVKMGMVLEPFCALVQLLSSSSLIFEELCEYSLFLCVFFFFLCL